MGQTARDAARAPSELDNEHSQRLNVFAHAPRDASARMARVQWSPSWRCTEVFRRVRGVGERDGARCTVEALEFSQDVLLQ